MKSAASPLHALTGMRFVAAFAVFIHHIQGQFGLPQCSLPLGNSAVSFFFVLSGFILTYVYHDRQQSSDDVRRYYYTRWARIWPLHIVCLLIWLSAITRWSDVTNSGVEQVRLGLNALLLQSWVPSNPWAFGFNGVSWSISAEMFFYLMFPWFLCGGARNFRTKYGALVAVNVVALIGLQWVANLPGLDERIDFVRLLHVNPALRLPEFCTGMAVGFVYLNRPVIAGGSWVRQTIAETLSLLLIAGFWAAILGSGITQAVRTSPLGGVVFSTWIYFSSAAAVFACVIYVFARSNGLWARLFGSRLMVFLGEISFAFYMIHMFVIQIVRRMDWSMTTASPWIIAVCCLGITLSFSAILYKVVEVPAKSALLALYDGRHKMAISTFGAAIRQFRISMPVWVALALFILPVCYLNFGVNSIDLDDHILQVIRESDPQLSGMTFDNAIVLLGHRVMPVPEGLEIELVWKKYRNMGRRRFMHGRDSDGRIVCHGPVKSAEFFDTASFREPFLEKVHLPSRSLNGAKSISIGFHSKENGMAEVKSANSSHRARNLEIVSFERFAQLMPELSPGQTAIPPNSRR